MYIFQLNLISYLFCRTAMNVIYLSMFRMSCFSFFLSYFYFLCSIFYSSLVYPQSGIDYCPPPFSFPLSVKISLKQWCQKGIWFRAAHNFFSIFFCLFLFLPLFSISLFLLSFLSFYFFPFILKIYTLGLI